MLLPLFGLTVFGQSFAFADLAIVALLVVLEGMLSIDNALVLGLLAKRLPRHEQSKALWYGLVGAFAFRFLAVVTASLLLRWTFAKFLGGAYLVYIAVRHLFFESKEEAKETIKLDEYGHPILVEEDTGKGLTAEEEELEIRGRVPVYMTPETRKKLGLASFWPTVFIIELTDIAFAVDSILAAIAMVGSPPPGTPADALHPKLWVVILGGLIGLMLMRVAARWFIYLLERFPRFEISAYLLVIAIGLKLLADWGLNSDWSFGEPADAALRAGGWKAPFAHFDDLRRQAAHDYEGWLQQHWPLEVPHHELPVMKAGERPPVHVLDFHSWRRPEFLAFWSAMLLCFCIGFVPHKDRRPSD